MAKRVKITKSEPENAAASKFMSIVTDDLLLEILVRLIDARSAILCSIICKRWFSLIFCQEFCHKFTHHHHHQHQRPLPFAVLSDKLPLRVLLSEKSKFRGGKILCGKQSGMSKLFHRCLYGEPSEIYGKICMSFDDLLLLFSFMDKNYYICNLLTRQYVALPRPPIDGFAKWSGLVFEPNSCSNRVRCNCTINRRFRVLLVPYFGKSPVIFCSETGKWTQEILPFKFTNISDSKLVASNGILHFLEKNANANAKLIAFDPFKDINHPERCRFIDLPILAGRGYIGMVRNQVRLALLDSFKNGSGFTFVLKIWELNYNYNDPSRLWASWILVHEVTSRKMVESGNFYVESFHPDDGDVIFFHNYDFSSNYVSRYNIRRDKFELFWKLPVSNTDGSVTLVHPVWPTPIPSLGETFH